MDKETVSMILGIDPGKTGGFCFFDKGKIETFGAIDTHNIKEIWCLIELCKSYKCKHVFIEDVHAVFGKLNVKHLLNHAKNIGMMQGLFLAYKIKVELVQASAWQSVELIHGGKRPGKGQTKEFAKVIAEQYGVNFALYKKVDHSGIADAVCIAAYGERVKA
jgi:hypothetical protein